MDSVSGLGNIIWTDYYDDTWETFGYDKNGSLIETENEHVKVKLERDPSGQMIKEWQNDHWITSSYDELGNRSQITSSLGAKIDVARNEMENVSQITASHSEQEHWTASMQYNELGQEIERILPGDVISKWQYDVAGRPTHHRINSQNRDTRRRTYNWDVNHRLRSMVNELTGVKVTYGYDEFSNLKGDFMSINKLIENFECPLINAFFFSNEDILVLDNNNEWIRVLCKSTIESFFKYNDGDSVCHFDILKKYETDDFTVSIGEGSFGGDGIVQLNDKTGKLIWFLFLDNSNPFIKAELENDSIQVTSTKGIKIKIPIRNPEKISIVK